MTHLAPEVRSTILCVFAALGVASAFSIALQRMKPERDFAELRSRIRTWWMIVGLFSASLFWSPKAAIAFLGFVSFLALKEFLSMTPTRRADRRVLFYAYLAVIIQYWFAGSGSYGMFIMFIPVLMFVWLPTRMLIIGHTDGFLRAAGTLHWGLMISVFSLSHAAYLLMMQTGELPRIAPAYPSDVGTQFPGPGLLMFLILATELNDIFQYIWGKTLGKRKVAPLVSPGKTYAGLIGGVLSTIVFAALIGPSITLFDVQHSIIAGTIIGIAGFAGDLCMSALKRDLKIKDFGATLPGHGGVLDRVDSLVFTAPLFFHFVYYCYG
ncbi:MAG: phosphatidate cytidylyltransferase [Rubripirellula sp.]